MYALGLVRGLTKDFKLEIIPSPCRTYALRRFESFHFICLVRKTITRALPRWRARHVGSVSIVLVESMPKRHSGRFFGESATKRM